MRNFENVLAHKTLRYITNSVIIGGGCTIVGLLIACLRPTASPATAEPAGGYHPDGAWCPASPSSCLLFIIFRRLELIDTYTSLILAHMLVGLPFIVWVMVPSSRAFRAS